MMNQVPVIDISQAHTSDTLVKLDRACRDHGFFLLTGHGHDATIARMWDNARKFFAAPRASRLVILRTEDKPLGYYDRELTKQKRDLKEVFDYMRPAADFKARNQWPPEMSEFKQSMTDFYEAMSELASNTLSLLHKALNIDGADQQLIGDANTSNVRLNNYPIEDPLTETEKAEVNALGDMALHHHTDPGLITLLLQDDTGGLQALSAADGWIDVPPLEGAVIVNLGDALQAWSNDEYRAAVAPGNSHGRQTTNEHAIFLQPSRRCRHRAPSSTGGRATQIPGIRLEGIHPESDRRQFSGPRRSGYSGRQVPHRPTIATARSRRPQSPTAPQRL